MANPLAPPRPDRARNATFSLHPPALKAIEDLVAAGRAPSKNALVDALVRREWRRVQREHRHAERLRACQEAMGDPLFLRDVEEIEQAFATADAETARLVE